MKNILIATDFSDSAKAAAYYGAEFAKELNSKITLYHVYHVPVAGADAAIVIPSLDEIEKNCLDNLESLKNELIQKIGSSLSIEYKCDCGFAIDEINNLITTKNIDLVIMGMHGDGYISEKLIGSTATAFVRKAKCPVLIIDKQIKYKKISRIVLAADYKKIQNPAILNPVKQIVKNNNAKLFVLNVVKELQAVPSVSEASEGVKLDNILNDVNHSFHSIENEEIVDGINDFAAEKQADLIVTIPRSHNIFWSMFNEPTTKKIAFHTNIPLLAIHE